MKIGKLKVFTGPMFSSKTTMLLNTLVKTNTIILIKPEFDKRYSEKDVLTHDKISATELGLSVVRRPLSWNIANDKELQEVIKEKEVVGVGIDEAQFFTFIGYNIDVLNNTGIDVYASCLNLAHNGEVLVNSGEVLGRANEIEILKSVCVSCGAKATRTYKKNSNLEQELVEIGGEETYEPICLACWL